jgi:catechol-2,3-dioxygenase
MARPIVKDLCYVALYAPEPDILAEFYTSVLGFQIVAQSKLNAENIRSSVFLSNPTKQTQYQLAVFANHKMQNTAFEVDSLANLRSLYALFIERDLPIRWVLNHGVSLAFYFHDPVGNLIKLFWLTGFDYPQPHGHPIDLTQSEAALRQDGADLVAQLNRRRSKCL